MYSKFRYLLFFIYLFSCIGFAAQTNADFQEGKDYLRLPTPVATAAGKNQIEVLEFFSYGCPACNHFEPAIETWLASKPKNIVFDRVPVVFHQGWDVYAKTYYAAKNMGVVDKISPALFTAIHKEGRDLSSEEKMAQFFAQQGINPLEFRNAYHFSPSILAQMARANTLAHDYLVNDYLIKNHHWIPQVPTVAINGKYLVSAGLVNGNVNKFIQVINFLIAKESKK